VAESHDNRTSCHPVVGICREAVRRYGGRLVEAPDLCVLVAPGEGGANLMVAYADGEAVLWLDRYKWSEYTWTSEDRGELEDLAEAIDAVQRGDAEIHFRRQDHLLIHQGGRVGNQEIVDEPASRSPLLLRLSPWQEPSQDS
jgi:hypothetical protein